MFGLPISGDKKFRLFADDDIDESQAAETPLELPEEELPEENYVQTSFEVGDLLIFSAFLVHRSGENITKNIRWSIQLRYNNMAEPTFKERGFPMPYIYKPEENLVTPDFPKKEQLEEVFA
jgi:hypothetical protein